MNTFGKRLKFLRKSKKLTQKSLADLFKLAESTISMYERDEREPSFDLTNKIADYFEVTTDYLHGRTNEPTGTVSKSKLDKQDETYDSLTEITKLAEKYGLEQLGFFDIEEWKNLSPEEIKMLDAQFKAVANMAKERNEDKK